MDLNKDDEATQQLRRDAIAGKTMLFVLPPNIDGFVQQRQTVRFIKSLGVKVVPVFDLGKCGQIVYEIFAKSEEKFMDDFVMADLSTEPCANIVQALATKQIHVDSVFTPYENAIGLVGELNEALDCHGNSAKAYKIARSKNLAREITREAGLATPRTGVASNVEEFNKVLAHVLYPCIIKPSSGAGSCGVLRANNVDEASRAFDIISTDMAANSTLSCNLGLDVTTVLVEQFLIGDEFDVDMLICDGELKYAQVADNWPCLAPYYLESGCNMPSMHSEEKVQELIKYAFDCVKCMGFHSGPFHVEVMYTADGPVLIEVNARQGGGPNQIINLEMFGVNILENWIISTFGVPINPPRSLTPRCAMSQYSITATKTGVLVSNEHMERIQQHPMYFSSTIFATAGSKVVGLDTDFPMWTGEFIIKSEEPIEKVVAECKSIVAAMIVDIVPEPVYFATLQETTEETQVKRLNMIKGKSMLFVIPPNIPGFVAQKATVRYIRSLGVKVVAVFDMSPLGETLQKLFIGDDEETFMDKFIFAELNQHACKNIVEALEKSKIKVDAVFTPYENAIGLVGELNEALNCHGNSAEAYKIARSKNLARQVTKAAGLATPRSGAAESEVDFIEVVEFVGMPCIVKPSSGAGSCGVVRADSMEEAIAAFRSLSQDMKENTTLSCNLGLETTNVLVEQCLLGDEFDIDMLIYDGELKYAQLVDNWPCLKPYYLETGCNMPSIYPEDKQQELIEYAFDCVKCMGFHSGPFHVEVMYTADGPVLIEVNARQGGGSNQSMNIEMFGVNILQNWIISSFGVPINPPRSSQPSCSMVQYSYTATKTGILADEEHMKPILAHPYFYDSVDFVKTGDSIVGLDTGFPIWTNDFYLKGDCTVDELIKETVLLVENTEVNIVPHKDTEMRSKILKTRYSSKEEFINLVETS